MPSTRSKSIVNKPKRDTPSIRSTLPISDTHSALHQHQRSESPDPCDLFTRKEDTEGINAHQSSRQSPHYSSAFNLPIVTLPGPSALSKKAAKGKGKAKGYHRQEKVTVSTRSSSRKRKRESKSGSAEIGQKGNGVGDHPVAGPSGLASRSVSLSSCGQPTVAGIECTTGDSSSFDRLIRLHDNQEVEAEDEISPIAANLARPPTPVPSSTFTPLSSVHEPHSPLESAQNESPRKLRGRVYSISVSPPPNPPPPANEKIDRVIVVDCQSVPDLQLALSQNTTSTLSPPPEEDLAVRDPDVSAAPSSDNAPIAERNASEPVLQNEEESGDKVEPSSTTNDDIGVLGISEIEQEALAALRSSSISPPPPSQFGEGTTYADLPLPTDFEAEELPRSISTSEFRRISPTAYELPFESTSKSKPKPAPRRRSARLHAAAVDPSLDTTIPVDPAPPDRPESELTDTTAGSTSGISSPVLLTPALPETPFLPDSSTNREYSQSRSQLTYQPAETPQINNDDPPISVPTDVPKIKRKKANPPPISRRSAPLSGVGPVPHPTIISQGDPFPAPSTQLAIPVANVSLTEDGPQLAQSLTSTTPSSPLSSPVTSVSSVTFEPAIGHDDPADSIFPPAELCSSESGQQAPEVGAVSWESAGGSATTVLRKSISEAESRNLDLLHQETTNNQDHLETEASDPSDTAINQPGNSTQTDIYLSLTAGRVVAVSEKQTDTSSLSSLPSEDQSFIHALPQAASETEESPAPRVLTDLDEPVSSLAEQACVSPVPTLPPRPVQAISPPPASIEKAPQPGSDLPSRSPTELVEPHRLTPLSSQALPLQGPDASPLSAKLPYTDITAAEKVSHCLESLDRKLVATSPPSLDLALELHPADENKELLKSLENIGDPGPIQHLQEAEIIESLDPIKPVASIGSIQPVELDKPAESSQSFEEIELVEQVGPTKHDLSSIDTIDQIEQPLSLPSNQSAESDESASLDRFFEELEVDISAPALDTLVQPLQKGPIDPSAASLTLDRSHSRQGPLSPPDPPPADQLHLPSDSIGPSLTTKVYVTPSTSQLPASPFTTLIHTPSIIPSIPSPPPGAKQISNPKANTAKHDHNDQSHPDAPWDPDPELQPVSSHTSIELVAKPTSANPPRSPEPDVRLPGIRDPPAANTMSGPVKRKRNSSGPIPDQPDRPTSTSFAAIHAQPAISPGSSDSLTPPPASPVKARTAPLISETGGQTAGPSGGTAERKGKGKDKASKGKAAEGIADQPQTEQDEAGQAVPQPRKIMLKIGGHGKSASATKSGTPAGTPPAAADDAGPQGTIVATESTARGAKRSREAAEDGDKASGPFKGKQKARKVDAEQSNTAVSESPAVGNSKVKGKEKGKKRDAPEQGVSSTETKTDQTAAPPLSQPPAVPEQKSKGKPTKLPAGRPRKSQIQSPDADVVVNPPTEAPIQPTPLPIPHQDPTPPVHTAQTPPGASSPSADPAVSSQPTDIQSNAIPVQPIAAADNATTASSNKSGPAKNLLQSFKKKQGIETVTPKKTTGSAGSAKSTPSSTPGPGSSSAKGKRPVNASGGGGSGPRATPASSGKKPGQGDASASGSGPGLGSRSSIGTPTASKPVPGPPTAAPRTSLLASTLSQLKQPAMSAKIPDDAKKGKVEAPKVERNRFANYALTPSEQAEYDASAEQRAKERARREAYSKNALNLNFARDSYKLDALNKNNRYFKNIPGHMGIHTSGIPLRIMETLFPGQEPHGDKFRRLALERKEARLALEKEEQARKGM